MGEPRHTYGRRGWCLDCGVHIASIANIAPCSGKSPRPSQGPRPTVQVMDGETGSDGHERCPSEDRWEDVPGLAPQVVRCVFDDGHEGRHVFADHRWGKRADHETTCPAPTPRAP